MFTLIFALFSYTILFAQGNKLLSDFENGKVNFTDSVAINPKGSMDTAIVDNPFMTAENMSSKVWQWKRVDMTKLTPAGVNEIWAGFYAKLKNELPAGYNRIEVKYLRTNNTSQLRMKAEGDVNKEINPVTPASATNTWETLVFDLAGNGIANIKILSFFPDYYEPVDPTAVSYIDDIIAYQYPTAVDPNLPNKEIKAYYSNGEIRLENYVGRVSVFDMIGRKVFEGDALEGKLRVNLEKGIYIISTTEGKTKISLQ
ncbi:MAG TPA: hypothetical protein DCL77_13750 [Prolixibacteraceae bacterium]|nr:hypothetical protein [Prolixibacteraceae bacterium]